MITSTDQLSGCRSLSQISTVSCPWSHVSWSQPVRPCVCVWVWETRSGVADSLWFWGQLKGGARLSAAQGLMSLWLGLCWWLKGGRGDSSSSFTQVDSFTRQSSADSQANDYSNVSTSGDDDVSVTVLIPVSRCSSSRTTNVQTSLASSLWPRTPS